MSDLISIDPAAALAAAVSLGTELRVLSAAVDPVSEIDRAGADLEIHTTPLVGLLREVADELGLLGATLDSSARAALAADSLAGSPTTWLDSAERWAHLLDASLLDDVGVDAVDVRGLARLRPPDVRSWWNSLTSDQRLAATHGHPETIGSADGIPLSVRIDANHVTIARLAAEPDHDPRLHQYLDDGGLADRSRQIVLLDLRGDGRVAELIGDLATATSFAVIVPGMGSELANAAEVGDAARNVHGDEADLAIIAWTGYDAPKGLRSPDSVRDLWHDLTAADEVSSDDLARRGAPRLISFGDALSLDVRAPVTFIGHSYGSLTLGHAISGGLTGSNAVFLGSPGVGVDTVGEFPDRAFDGYFAADAHGDPVADLEHFGDAPTDPDFGALTFDVGESGGAFLQRHDDYFENGVAIGNLRAIIRGDAPSPDRGSLAGRFAELLDDLGVGGANVVENVGEHLEDLAHDALTTSRDGMRWLDDTFGEGVGHAVAGLELIGGSVLEGVEWLDGWAPGTMRDLLPDPLGWFD